MAVPAVPTFDDWAFELIDLSDGTFVSLNESIIAIEGWVGRGATAHRLESAHLEIPSTSIGADYIDFDNLQLLRIVPYSFEGIRFNGDTTSINFGSNATIDNIPAADYTVDFWCRLDSAGEASGGRLFHKTNFWLQCEAAALYIRTNHASSPASARMPYTYDGKWHHVEAVYDLGTLTFEHFFLDGRDLIYNSVAGVGAYNGDAAAILYGGNIGPGIRCLDGDMAWMRFSTGKRHTASFMPPRAIPPPDGNTIEQWGMNDGTGTTVIASVTSPACDGTLANGTWGIWGDSRNELWGVIVKDHESYSERGIRDPIKITIAPVEYLIHSRVVFHKANAGADVTPISGTAVAADDYLKDLVSGCTTGVDADADARTWDWGTLAIAGDLSAAGNVTMGIVGGYLDEAIDAIAKSQDIDWELRPSVAAGAFTFTFSTAYPRGGSDLSTGASRVIINDIGAMVPRGERYFDREGMSTAMYARGFADVVKSATYATLGRWENATDLEDGDALEAAMSRMGYKSGSTFGFEAAATAGQCRWMAEYDVGDLVVRNNIRLEIDAANEEINGIKFSFPDRVLQLEIRWGNKEPTNTSKRGGGRWRPPPTDMEWYPAYVTPEEVGGANAEGSDETRVRGDHIHKGVIQVAAIGEAAPAAGIITFTSSGATITLTRPAGDTVNFETALPGGCYWQRTGTILHQANDGDDVQIFTAAPALVAHIVAASGESYWAGDMYLGSATGNPANRLHLNRGGAAVYMRAEGSVAVLFGEEGSGIGVVDNLNGSSVSIRHNGVANESAHFNTSGLAVVNSGNFYVQTGAVGVGTVFLIAGATGLVTVYNDIIPNPTDTHFLGSLAAFFQATYTQRIYIDSAAEYLYAVAATGQLHLVGSTNIQLHAGGVISLIAIATAVHPNVTDAIDLGTNAKMWNEVYAQKYYVDVNTHYIDIDGNYVRITATTGLKVAGEIYTSGKIEVHGAGIEVHSV